MPCVLPLTLALLAAAPPPFVFEDPSSSLRESEPPRAVLVVVEWADPSQGLLVRSEVRQAGRQRTLRVVAWRDERRLGRSSRPVPAKEWDALSKTLERLGARALADAGLDGGAGLERTATVYLGGDAPHRFTTRLAVESGERQATGGGGPGESAPWEQTLVVRELEGHSHSEALARKWVAAAPKRRLPEIPFDEQPRSAFDRPPPRDLRILVEHSNRAEDKTTHRVSVYEAPGGRLRVKSMTVSGSRTSRPTTVELGPEQAKQLWDRLAALGAWRLSNQTLRPGAEERSAADVRFLLRRGGRDHRFTCRGGIAGAQYRVLEALALAAGHNERTLPSWLVPAPAEEPPKPRRR